MLRTLPKLIVLALSCAVAAQDSGSKPPTGKLLKITSPASGTTVNPGQTISVTVTSNIVVNQILVIGGATGFSSLATSVPAHFSLSIPTDISCRWYTLKAVGTTASGQEVESPELRIHVEGPGLPASLYTQMPAIELGNLGDNFPIKISANFSNGSSCDVTESSKLVFSSSNTNVATVNTTGMVTANGVGQASITATYGSKVHITIPITVPPQGRGAVSHFAEF
jgi:hypothetical protein